MSQQWTISFDLNQGNAEFINDLLSQDSLGLILRSPGFQVLQVRGGFRKFEISGSGWLLGLPITFAVIDRRRNLVRVHTKLLPNEAQNGPDVAIIQQLFVDCQMIELPALFEQDNEDRRVPVALIGELLSGVWIKLGENNIATLEFGSVTNPRLPPWLLNVGEEAIAPIEDQCRSCKWLHGKPYGGKMMICGMHPYGPEGEACADHTAKS